MCGIVGFISGAGKSGWPQDRVTFLRQGLVVDTLRGFDSTGVFTVDAGAATEPAYWEKDVLSGPDFVQHKDFQKMVSNASDLRAAIGHNRAATKGAVTSDNAHPFQVGNITLVHNGTLSYLSGLPLSPYKDKQLKGVDVDSEVIAHNLAHKPIEEWYEDLVGAWALVWHDASDGSINMVRNAQRPLHIAKVEKEDTILIASEADMLSFVSRRARINIEDIYLLGLDTLFKWKPDTPVMSPVTTKLQTYPQSYASRGGYGQQNVAGSRRSAYQSVPFTATESDKVFLCGKMRDIPTEHQLLLMNKDLEPADRLEFSPWEIPRERGSVPVWGWLDEAESPALVIGCPDYAIDTVGTKTKWVVRPLTVTYPDNGSVSELCEDGIVICKYVQIKSTAPPARKPKEDKDEEGHHRLYAVGKDGVRLTIEEFRDKTRDGCAYCMDNISFFDDLDITWTGEGRPVCAKCTEDMLEGWDRFGAVL